MTDDAEPLSADQVRMVAAAQDLAAGDVIAIDNGLLTKVHPAGLCAGTHCWVHNPSDHHMTGWPIRWRDDKRTAERVCEHGIGHPDPDDRAHHHRQGRDVSIHGCDDCCAPRPPNHDGTSPTASQGDCSRQRTEAMNETKELTGDEGGRWRVFTQRTTYDFDLDAGTVTRIPGPDSSRTINDCERRILEIKACKVGQRGYWTMRPDGAEETTEYFWQVSTEIRRIEQSAAPA